MGEPRKLELKWWYGSILGACLYPNNKPTLGGYCARVWKRRDGLWNYEASMDGLAVVGAARTERAAKLAVRRALRKGVKRG